MREDIHELSNEELAAAVDNLATVVSEDIGAKRCAETLNEAAKRLREAK